MESFEGDADGVFERTQRLLERRRFAEAVRLMRTFHGENEHVLDDDTHARALALLAAAEAGEGDPRAARQHLDRALALRGAIPQGEAVSWYAFAVRLALAQRDLEGALAKAEPGALAARAWCRSEPENPDASKALATALALLGDARLAAGRADSASAVLEEALRLFRDAAQQAGAEEGDHHRERCHAAYSHARALARRGLLTEAREAVQTGLEVAHGLVVMVEESPTSLREVAFGHELEAEILEQMEESALARDAHRRAGAAWTRLLDFFGPTEEDLRAQLAALDRHAHATQVEDDHEAAQDLLLRMERTLSMLEEHYPSAPERRFDHNLVVKRRLQVLWGMGARDEARELSRRELRDTVPGDVRDWDDAQIEDAASGLEMHASLSRALEERGEAIETGARALQLRRLLHGRDPEDLSALRPLCATLAGQVRLLWESDLRSRAVELDREHEAALHLLFSRGEVTHKDLQWRAQALENRAAMALELQEREPARRLLEEYEDALAPLGGLESLSAPELDSLAQSWFRLSELELEACDAGQAEGAAARCLALHERITEGREATEQEAFELSRAHGQLAKIRIVRGRPEPFYEAAETALALREGLRGRTEDEAIPAVLIAEIHLTLLLGSRVFGRTGRAARHLRATVAALRRARRGDGLPEGLAELHASIRDRLLGSLPRWRRWWLRRFLR